MLWRCRFLFSRAPGRAGRHGAVQEHRDGISRVQSSLGLSGWSLLILQGELSQRLLPARMFQPGSACIPWDQLLPHGPGSSLFVRKNCNTNPFLCAYSYGLWIYVWYDRPKGFTVSHNCFLSGRQKFSVLSFGMNKTYFIFRIKNSREVTVKFCGVLWMFCLFFKIVTISKDIVTGGEIYGWEES